LQRLLELKCHPDLIRFANMMVYEPEEIEAMLSWLDKNPSPSEAEVISEIKSIAHLE